MAQRKLFRIPQAVEYVDAVVKAPTFRRWILNGEIETVRIGRAVCIPQDALDKLIEDGTMPALEHRSAEKAVQA